MNRNEKGMSAMDGRAYLSLLNEKRAQIKRDSTFCGETGTDPFSIVMARGLANAIRCFEAHKSEVIDKVLTEGLEMGNGDPNSRY